MDTERVPDYLVDPDQKIIHTLGCREDGTFSECALIITQHYVYVVGSFSLCNEGRKAVNTKGFKVIALASVKDINEKIKRSSFLITLSLIFTLILILFGAGYNYGFPVNPVQTFLYEMFVFICAAGSFIGYIMKKKYFVTVLYKGGEIQFRNRLHIGGAVRKAREKISSHIHHNILIKN